MALLQRQQSLQQQQKDQESRRPSIPAKSSISPVGEGQEGGGGGRNRRASSFMGLTGPKTAATLSNPSSSRPPPTLFGLLASKRLAKRFASRFQKRRLGTMSSLVSSGEGPLVHAEPTYRMEPRRKFRPKEVEDMLKTLLEEKMAKFSYSARICANMCKVLGDDIKEQVKLMNFDRYKIVSNVVIGQKKDQAVITCSRCAWDEKLDSFASYTFQNEHIFCTATVFGIYME